MSGKKVVCPYCFDVFKRHEVWYRCNNPSCKDEGDEPMKKFWGQDVKDKKAFRPTVSYWDSVLGHMPKADLCPVCKQKTTKVICPHCHNELPREMVEDGGAIISIIGARSSGKTNYITTLINELQHKGHKLNLSLQARNVGRNPGEYTTDRYQRDFFNTLYVQNTCPPQTMENDVRGKIPLIYKLSNNQAKKHLYLVFYDTAGENFIDNRKIAAHVKFLQNSEGIIFLLDTFNIPYVHKQLETKWPDLKPAEMKYNRIIENVTGYFDNQEEKVRKAFYAKPMAMTFSKIDSILLYGDALGTSDISGLRTDSNSSFLVTSRLSMDDLDSVGDGLQAALDQCWNEAQFLENNKCFKDLHYFGISALGNMPDMRNRIEDIRPYRVMDPLVWILHRLKFPLPLEKK